MDYEHLIDRSQVEAIDKKIAILDEKIAAAFAVVLDAENGLKAAGEASRAAIASGADGIAEEHEIGAARIRLEAAKKRHAFSCEGRNELIHEREAAVKALANPIFWAGLDRRLAASRAAEKARAELSAAEADYHAAGRQIRAAHAAGFQAPHGGPILDRGALEMLGPDDELSMWRATGFNLEDRTYGGKVMK
ncbi:hypothetical protein [Acidocella facilis]|uniref:hypothetical protein n=1 Tax=Acidocella facilis TaxID=525 RepID=UPI001F1B0BEC|nr:hypothetical protein [Acidocella facilis]